VVALAAAVPVAAATAAVLVVAVAAPVAAAVVVTAVAVAATKHFTRSTGLGLTNKGSLGALFVLCASYWLL